MKRESKSYQAHEVTYTFTRDEMIAALCKKHNIDLPPQAGLASSWKVYDEADGGISIRLRFEQEADSPSPTVIPDEMFPGENR